MQTLKARIHNHCLVPDESMDLPEGTVVELVSLGLPEGTIAEIVPLNEDGTILELVSLGLPEGMVVELVAAPSPNRRVS